MANWVGRHEQTDPQGSQVSESTENERILTVLFGPSPSPGDSQFIVLDSTEPRPVSSNTVLWVGGSSKPAGMVDGDYWVREGEEYTDPVIPDPDPGDPGTSTQHSVWGDGNIAPFPDPVLETDAEPIRVSAGFYTYSDLVDGWRAVGGKIYVPAGVTIPSGDMFLYGPSVSGKPDLGAPIQTSSFQGITGPGWASTTFDPVVMTPAEYYFIGYELPNNSYLHTTNTEASQFISSNDGSNLVLMGASETSTARRSWFRYGAGVTTGALPGLFYSVDIVVDEGV